MEAKNAALKSHFQAGPTWLSLSKQLQGSGRIRGTGAGGVGLSGDLMSWVTEGGLLFSPLPLHQGLLSQTAWGGTA